MDQLLTVKQAIPTPVGWDGAASGWTVPGHDLGCYLGFVACPGDPTPPDRPAPAPAPDASVALALVPAPMAAKIRPIAITGCWEWIGARDDRGYGNVKVNGRVKKAHRVIYEACRGPIAPRLECDHLCRVPWCVSPDHMDLVQHRENVRRGAARWIPGARQRAKRRCPSGHPYTKANTYVHPRTGGRSCRQCDRERKREATHGGVPEHRLSAGTGDVGGEPVGGLP